MNIFRKNETTVDLAAEFSRREAENNTQRAKLNADNAELMRIDSEDAAATAEVSAATEEARPAHDPITDAPQGERDRTMRRLRDARRRKAKVDADRAALGLTREDLAARVQELTADERALKLDRIRAACREALRTFIEAGNGLAMVNERLVKLCREAMVLDPNGGWKHLGLPLGVFDPLATDVGRLCVWQLAQRELVESGHADILDPGTRATIEAEIAADREHRKPRRFAHVSFFMNRAA